MKLHIFSYLHEFLSDFNANTLHFCIVLLLQEFLDFEIDQIHFVCLPATFQKYVIFSKLPPEKLVENRQNEVGQLQNQKIFKVVAKCKTCRVLELKSGKNSWRNEKMCNFFFFTSSKPGYDSDNPLVMKFGI